MTDTSLATLWGGLQADASRLGRRSLRDLFAADADRFAAHCHRLDDLVIDFSKEKLDSAAWAALLRLAEARGVEARRDAMFAGEPINIGLGQRVTINELVGQLAGLVGASHVDSVHEAPRAGDVRHSLADISRAQNWLGYAPVQRFEAGLAETVQWMRPDTNPGTGQENLSNPSQGRLT